LKFNSKIPQATVVLPPFQSDTLTLKIDPLAYGAGGVFKFVMDEMLKTVGASTLTGKLLVLLMVSLVISSLPKAFAVMVMIPLQSYAATPKETVETEVNKVLTTLSDPAFQGKSKDAKINEVGKIISEVFDFKELSKRTLGKNWKKLSAEQQTEFVDLFRKLLQGVYADRLLAYSDQKVLFDKERMLKKGRAEVQSYLQTSDGTKIPLFYRLTNKSGSWRVYDVIIEGVSMVKNYRTQFREIIAKDSPEKLLEILREKTK
jgi:phospholipid transport system substrate-binding protein